MIRSNLLGTLTDEEQSVLLHVVSTTSSYEFELRSSELCWLRPTWLQLALQQARIIIKPENIFLIEAIEKKLFST